MTGHFGPDQARSNRLDLAGPLPHQTGPDRSRTDRGTSRRVRQSAVGRRQTTPFRHGPFPLDAWSRRRLRNGSRPELRWRQISRCGGGFSRHAFESVRHGRRRCLNTHEACPEGALTTINRPSNRRVRQRPGSDHACNPVPERGVQWTAGNKFQT